MAELDVEDFYDLSVPLEPAVSPDGERVAFLATESDPEEDRRRTSLFVAPTDGSRDPYRLTRASDAQMPKWSPDGSRLGFVGARDEDVAMKVGRDEEDDEDDDADADGAENGDAEESEKEDDESEDGDGPPGGEEGPKPQVWVFDLERGGDARQVTDREEGVREFDWGPDGDRIVVSARDPTDEQQEMLAERRDDGPIEVERLQHKAEGVGFLDDVTTYLFVVDLDTGEERRLDDAFGQGANEPIMGLQPAWGPGERIAFASNRTEWPDDSSVVDLYTIDPDGGNLRQITDSELRAVFYEWGPDGDRLAFVGGDPENWYRPSELYVCDPGDPVGDPDGETAEYWSVTGSLDRTLPFLSGPSWLDGDTLLSGIGDEGLTRLVRAPADEDDPERVFPAQTRDRTLAFPDAAGGTVAAVLSDPGGGQDVWTLDVADLDADDPGSLTRVCRLNDALLADVALPQCRRVTWENGDGIEVEGVVYLPPGFEPDEDDPLPVIAKIHGGPMSYDAPEFRFEYAYWTGQGYAVYCTNYRGSTSYGREFAERLMGIRGDLETDDVISGLEHLADLGWVDPDRSLATGFSYGGITTANIVTLEEDPFAAAAAEHGIYDWASTFGTGDTHNWQEWEFGLPWEEPETYDRISATSDVGNVDTPLLITAGENDWRCPPTQAEQLYVSVRKQDVPAKLVIYQDEHHNIGDPDRAIHRLETITEWFRKYDPGYESEDDGDDGSGDGDSGDDDAGE